MRHYLTFLILIFFSQAAMPQEGKMAGMHGIHDDEGRLVLNYQGYTVYVTTVAGNLGDSRVLSTVRKDFKINDSITGYPDPLLGRDNIVMEFAASDNERLNLITSAVCYALAKSDEEIVTMVFQKPGKRNIGAEYEVIDEYFRSGFAPYISANRSVDRIDFAGRIVRLDDACQWRGPNSIYYMRGQVSWSVFPSYEEAETDVMNRIAANDSKNRDILSDEDLDVIFEGVPTVARRIVYNNPGSYYPLAVYYLAQEVNGYAVSCVLSNDVYDTNDYGLASILQKFMSIPNIPENARLDNSETTDTEDQSGSDLFPLSRYGVPSMEIQVGTLLPLGGLRNTYKVAPSFGLYIGIPFRNKMALDLGMYFAFPVSSKNFDYYEKRDVLDAKARVVLGLNLRVRYQRELSKDLYITPYIGLGASGLITNLKKYNDDESNYDMTTLDVYGGLNLRYKRVGFYIEYHQLPYSMSNHVRSEFGNSVINTGLFYAF